MLLVSLKLKFILKRARRKRPPRPLKLRANPADGFDPTQDHRHTDQEQRNAEHIKQNICVIRQHLHCSRKRARKNGGGHNK
jgi:hypothetical protein